MNGHRFYFINYYYYAFFYFFLSHMLIGAGNNAGALVTRIKCHILSRLSNMLKFIRRW